MGYATVVDAQIIKPEIESMNFKAIYLAMSPLKRLPYLAGQIGLLLTGAAVLGALRLTEYFYPTRDEIIFYVTIAVALAFLLYAVFLTLRRMIDIGIASWNAALVVTYLVGNAVYPLLKVFPLVGQGVIGIYLLLMLLVRTGAVSKREPQIPA